MEVFTLKMTQVAKMKLKLDRVFSIPQSKNMRLELLERMKILHRLKNQQQIC